MNSNSPKKCVKSALVAALVTASLYSQHNAEKFVERLTPTEADSLHEVISSENLAPAIFVAAATSPDGGQSPVLFT